MKFTNYKKLLVGLLFAASLLLGLYLEAKLPDTPNINDIDFSNAAAIGLTRGQLICSERAKIEFVYSNFTNDVSLKQICQRLDGIY